MPKLTVLSFGAGQDSTCLLYKAALDEAFRQRFIIGDFIVVMSDTGDEHPKTRLHIRFCKTYCAERGIPFFYLTPDKGYHPRTWQNYRGHLRDTGSIGSKAYPKTCTDNLKIKPIYNFLNNYVAEKYGVLKFDYPYKTRNALVQFSQLYGKIRVMIGIAAGEEGRVAPFTAETPKWMRLAIEREYPLITLGLDRAGCQDYIRSVNLPLPPPSNCMLCPFMSKIELLWLFRLYPADFHDWVGLEQAKFKKHAKEGKRNLGVWGSTKALPVILQEAEAEYGHMSVAELEEYKMSHGHCVKSRY